MDIRKSLDMLTRLEEARSAPLFHGTDLQGAMKILNSGQIEASDKRMDDEDSYSNISLTRDPRLRYYQVDGEDHPGHSPVVFVLNQQKLAQRFKLKPFDYAGAGRHGNKESEEQVLASELDIDIYVDAVHLYSFPKKFLPNQEDLWHLELDPDSDSEAKMRRGLKKRLDRAYDCIQYKAEQRGLLVVDHRDKKPDAIMRANVQQNIDQLK